MAAAPGVSFPELVQVVATSRPAWRAHAACRDYPSIDWFPSRGESAELAKAVCRGCQVRPECLAEVLDDVHVRGVWGGESEWGRRQIRAARRRTA
jgi:WhiB family transcriptional regulator, redox-sensing transcriptional regulator